jgi:hypothetical protein
MADTDKTETVKMETQKIYKYQIPVETENEIKIDLPSGARVLSAREQQGQLYMWALVDSGKPVEARYFRLFTTGQQIENAASLAFVGTFQLQSGNLVYHLFEAR